MKGAPLRLGTCRNSPRGLHWAPTVTERDAVSGLMRTTRVCAYCHTVYPLGPSDETPVAVEIRAAELAEPGALLRNGHEGNGRCDVGDCWYSDHDEYPDDWHAGYLARVIATHGEDQ